MVQDCQKDLDEALPAYFAAMKALKSLDKKSIGEVKSFAKPPPMVAYVLEAVCILLNKDTDWDSAKALMGDSKFMDMLLNYDKDNIDPKLIKKVGTFSLSFPPLFFLLHLPSFPAHNIA